MTALLHSEPDGHRPLYGLSRTRYELEAHTYVKDYPTATEPPVRWTLPDQGQRDYINCNSLSVAGNIFEYESQGISEGLMLDFKLFDGRTLVPYSSGSQRTGRPINKAAD